MSNYNLCPQSINTLLKPFFGLKCSAVWRSIGSNVFFEFGALNFFKNKSGIDIPRAEISIGIHADFWKLFSGEKIILDADTVDDDLLASQFNEHIRGVHIPKFQCDEEGGIILQFSELLILKTSGFEDWACYKNESEITIDFIGGEILEVQCYK